MRNEPKNTLHSTPGDILFDDPADQEILTPSSILIDEYSGIVDFHENVVNGLDKVRTFVKHNYDINYELLQDKPDDQELIGYCDMLMSYITGIENVMRYHAVEADFVREKLDELIASLSEDNN